MELKELVNELKNLSAIELKKLASILETDVEADIGLTKGGKPIIHTDSGPNDPPSCPTGYYWDTETQKCILDVG